MLILTRRFDESIVIDDNIVITVLSLNGNTVRFGIEAPKKVPIHRQEIYNLIQQKKTKNAELTDKL